MKLVKPDYNNSNIGIPNSLLKYYGLETKYDSTKELDELLKLNHKNILYIILDGMGISVMNKHLDKKGFFRRNLIKKVTTVYPSTTVCATTALHSGLSGIESSWLGWHMKFKKYDESIELFSNLKYYSREYVDISKNIKYTSIYDRITSKNSDIKYHRIFPKKAAGDYDTLEDMIEKTKEICENDENNLISFYYHEPDSILHKYGNENIKVTEELQILENKIEELVDSLEDTLVVITADHGHIDVANVNLYDFKEINECLLFPPVGEFRCAQLYVKESKKEIFRELFEKEFINDFLLYSKEEFIKSGLIGSGDIHNNIEEFVGDFVAVAINNIALTYNDGTMFDVKHTSEHSGLTEDEMMVPIIIVNKK